MQKKYGIYCLVSMLCIVFLVMFNFYQERYIFDNTLDRYFISDFITLENINNKDISTLKNQLLKYPDTLIVANYKTEIDVGVFDVEGFFYENSSKIINGGRYFSFDDYQENKDVRIKTFKEKEFKEKNFDECDINKYIFCFEETLNLPSKVKHPDLINLFYHSENIEKVYINGKHKEDVKKIFLDNGFRLYPIQYYSLIKGFNHIMTTNIAAAWTATLLLLMLPLLLVYLLATFILWKKEIYIHLLYGLSLRKIMFQFLIPFYIKLLCLVSSICILTTSFLWYQQRLYLHFFNTIQIGLLLYLSVCFLYSVFFYVTYKRLESV